MLSFFVNNWGINSNKGGGTDFILGIFLRRREMIYMTLGEKLLVRRKEIGLSQEDVADRLGVARQTISKWENDETVPDVDKINLLSKIYCVSYDYFVKEETSTLVDEIDWTSAWAKKYPILLNYQKNDVDKYHKAIYELYLQMKNEFHFSIQDTFLVLKDILYKEYLKEKKKK